MTRLLQTTRRTRPAVRRHGSLAALLLALALVVSACAGDDEGTGDETDTAPDTEDSEETSADDGGDDDQAAADDGADDDTGDGGDDATAAAREFYEGQTVEIAVQYDAGGGFDTYARQFAPFLEERLGATVIVVNEPGAGGLISLANTQRGEPDGLRIQFANGPFSVAPDLADAEGAEFDLAEWNWIGALVVDPQLVVAPSDHEVDDFQTVVDDTEREWVFAGTSGLPGVVIGETFGLTYRNVTGFDGSPDAVASMLRGETDFHAVSAETLIPQIEAGDLKGLALFGNERLEQLPDVPLLTEFETQSEEMAAALQAHIDVIESGRSFAVRDGVPEERVALLREAFSDIVADQEFLDVMEEVGRTVAPRDGQDVQTTIDRLYETAPEPYIQILAENYQQ
ncbi:MAG: tripartite tricarboxylate transporter substrate-binding protein [Dehalococcoidia bacterium]